MVKSSFKYSADKTELNNCFAFKNWKTRLLLNHWKNRSTFWAKVLLHFDPTKLSSKMFLPSKTGKLDYFSIIEKLEALFEQKCFLILSLQKWAHKLFWFQKLEIRQLLNHRKVRSTFWEKVLLNFEPTKLSSQIVLSSKTGKLDYVWIIEKLEALFWQKCFFILSKQNWAQKFFCFQKLAN